MAQGCYKILFIIHVLFIINTIQTNNAQIFNINNNQCPVEQKQAIDNKKEEEAKSNQSQSSKAASKLKFEKIPAKDLHISRYIHTKNLMHNNQKKKNEPQYKQTQYI